MRLLAPAKINLHLRVGPPMADGFHPLLTWMCTVGLFDTLEVSNQSAASLQIHLDCDDLSLPTDGRNLVVRATQLFCDASKITGSIHIRLRKTIPAGGGLGGGSSDAAAILTGLRKIFGGGCSDGRGEERESLPQLAAQLGSDVPFFLDGPSAVCRGRGEIVRPVAAPAAQWGILLMPPFGVSTPQAYRRFDDMNLGHAENLAPEPPWQSWTALPAIELMQRLVNDLEAPAFSLVPELDAVRRQCEDKLARPVRMSGSGSTLFTLYDRRDEAETASEKVQRKDLGSVVVALAPAIELILNEV